MLCVDLFSVGWPEVCTTCVVILSCCGFGCLAVLRCITCLLSLRCHMMSSLKCFLFAKRMPHDALLELELSMDSYIEQIYERECFSNRSYSLPLLRKLHHQYMFFGRQRVNAGSLKPSESLSAAAPHLMGPGTWVIVCCHTLGLL